MRTSAGTAGKFQTRFQSCRRAPSMSRASTSDTNPLALDSQEWVTLASGQQVRVDGLGYRPNVAVVLFNAEGKVFTCRRITGNTSSRPNWQFPQGGIDPGEDSAQAAVRELQEETNITSAEMIAQHPEWLRYDFDAHTKQRLGAHMDRYRGQKQRYFLMRFTGRDSEIQLVVEGHTPEFDAYEWVDIEDAPGRVAAFKEHVYRAVADEFAPIIAAHVQAS